ncbi:MAG: hypothetical protein HND57_12745 [Planctomycetes bacterium]|nr:hypothetical protein [Planctomycetota bacterium]
MKLRTSLIFGAAVLASASLAMGQDVLFDQGPSTGSDGGCWSNYTESQNFAEQVTFASDVEVTQMIIWTCISGPSGNCTIKVLVDDGAGNPGAEIERFSQGVDSWEPDGALYKVTMSFPAIAQSAGVTYWWGMSGDGFEAGQTSLHTPGDGTMAQFSGSSFSFHTGVGDQCFQLLGGSGGGFALDVIGDCPGTMEACATGASEGDKIVIIYSFNYGSAGPVPGCPSLFTDLASPSVAGSGSAGADGSYCASGRVPEGACGRVKVQALNRTTCEKSGVVEI